MAVPSAYRKLYKNRDIDGIKNLILGCQKEQKIAILNAVINDGATLNYELETENAAMLVEETTTQKDHKFGEQLTSVLHSLTDRDPVIHEFFQSLTGFWQKQLQSGDFAGSGPEGRPLDHYFCANNHAHLEAVDFCTKPGTLRCGSCLLVGYCSKECQIAHRKFHKRCCKNSKYRDDVWQPRWLAEGREPQFIDLTTPFKRLGMGLQLLGNTPALDIVRFDNNEMKDGTVWEKKMNIAFVASGDFRSMVETLASVPENYSGPIDIVLNDKMPIVVARNLLMASLLVLEGYHAIDTVINVWYSAALSHTQYFGPILNVTQKLVSIVEQQGHGKGQGKLEYRGCTIDMVDLSVPLYNLVDMMDYETDLQDALRQRNAVMLNPSRRDYVDRHMLGHKPFHKVAFDQFRMDGLLLPFESVRGLHNTQNKFLFSRNEGWMLNDNSDPKEGWDMIKVMKFGDEMKLPENDLYGRLYFYIRDRLTKMVATIRRVPTTIHVFHKEAKDLAREFKKKKLTFDRIDVSNICDENYMGVERVLRDWGPLLNKSNPNNAIVSLFLNWFYFKDLENRKEIETDEIQTKTWRLLGLKRGVKPSPLLLTKVSIMTEFLNQFLADTSKIFNRHLEDHLLLKNKPTGLKRRINHQIVPHRIMFPIDAPADATAEHFSAEEQYMVFNWSTNPVNRYVEWVLA